MKSLDITKPFTKLKETISIDGSLLVARHDDILTKMQQQIKALQLTLEAKDKRIEWLSRELGIPKDIETVHYDRKTLIERIEDMQEQIGYIARQQDLLKREQAKDKEA